MNFHKSIFKLECIPVGCVPPASVAVCWEGGVCLIACWDTRPTPLGVGLENPQVWAWRPPGQTPQPPPGCGPGDLLARPLNLPPGVGLETSWPDPSTFPQVWAWRFPPDPSTSPLGVGLETPLPGQTPQPPPGCGPGDPPRPLNLPPWVWAWRPPSPGQTPQPLGVGLKTSWPDPSTSPWVWAWRSPQTPQPPPLGVCLETPLPRPDPSTSPRVWAWRPPGQTPQPPPGFGPRDPPPTPQPPPWVWAWRPTHPCGQNSCHTHLSVCRSVQSRVPHHTLTQPFPL